MSLILAIDNGFSVVLRSKFLRALAGGYLSFRIAKFLISNRHNIIALLVAGPYRSAIRSILLRFAQRLLQAATATVHKDHWSAISALIEKNPTRPFNNGHAVAGAHRDTANVVIRQSIADAGKTVVELSPSERSIQYNRDNIIQHFAPADLFSVPSYIKSIKNTDVIIGIDTDYYITEPSSILGYGAPMAIYTFNPIHVSGLDGDCRFFIKDDLVHYQVDGGFNWVHPVWNWCQPGEYLAVPAKGKTWWEWFTLKLLRLVFVQKVHIFKVMHARPFPKVPNRAIVWALPWVSHCRFTWMETDINTRDLQRVSFADPADKGWNRIDFKDPTTNKLMVSLGRAGADLSVILEKELFDLAMGCGSPQSASSRLLANGIEPNKALPMMIQYYSKTPYVGTLEAPYVPLAVTPAVHWILESHCDIPDVKVIKYSRGIVTREALAPMIRRWETLCHSVEKRVVYTANTTIPFNRKWGDFAIEFVELLVPNAGVGVPFSVEETINNFTKPRQIAAIRRVYDTLDCDPKVLIEAFTKNEASMKTPRLISGWADMRWLVQVSRFTFAFKAGVLDQDHCSHWYYPGKTPQEIAQGIVDLASRLGSIMEADFSNMDGMTSAFAQHKVAFAARLRYFKPEYHPEIREFHNQLLSAPAKSKSFGYRYDAGVGVKSGSPTTTCDNTMLAAFFLYCAIRLTFPILTAEEAWALLTAIFGDDMVADPSVRDKLEMVVKAFGMVIKTLIPEKEKGLTFLGRVFPDPWLTRTSMQDPLRTYRKLHMSFRANVPVADVAMDRLTSYLVTDQYTPVIREYCVAVTKFYSSAATSYVNRKRRGDFTYERAYWSSHETESWPQYPGDYPLMLRCIASRLGLSEAVIHNLIDEFKSPDFDPFQFKPLMVDEVTPYSETLDDDCLPVVDEHYNNKVKNKSLLDKNVQRAIIDATKVGSSVRNGGSPDNGPTQSVAHNTGGDRESPPRGGQRRQRTRRSAQADGRETGPDAERVPAQANGQALPSGRGRANRPRTPGGRDRPAVEDRRTDNPTGRRNRQEAGRGQRRSS